MKTSNWSVTPKGAKDLDPAAFTVNETMGTVHLTIRRRQSNGAYARMRIVMTQAEARELAAQIAGAPAARPRRKVWVRP